MKLFLLTCLFLLGFQRFAVTQKFGFQLGLTLNLGTHVDAFGFSSNAYYTDYFYQFNLSANSKINFRSYGNRKYFLENRLATGLVLLAGKRDNIVDFQLDALMQNTKYRYSLGYNYIWYWDDIGTSQKSGGWSVGFRRFSLLFENDVFGGQAKDRFRSGIIEISYRRFYQKYFANLYIWTGETRNSVWNKAPLPDAPNGYRSLENLLYGKTSHGIVSLGIRSVLPFLESENLAQIYSAKIGVDSEQIRHFFQNKLSHDLILMPKQYKRNTPHYPRLNQEGLPIFKKEERKKDKLYLQVSVNEVWSN